MGKTVDVELDIVAAERRREAYIDILQDEREAQQLSLEGRMYSQVSCEGKNRREELRRCDLQLLAQRNFWDGIIVGYVSGRGFSPTNPLRDI